MKRRSKNSDHDEKALARRLIEHHFKTKPTRVVPQTGGLSNHVFLIKHTEGNFVVRIGNAPGKINAYIKEQWAVAKVREAGVPTPEILEVGNEVIPAPYMISRQAEGQPATTHLGRTAIIREMGRYAAIVNSIKTTGYGGVFDWSSNQLSRNETWEDFLEQELQLEARLDVLKKNKMMAVAKVRKLGEILEKGGGRHATSALNHGDIRLKNVLVDKKGKITTLIDWEDCVSSLAPHWDLSIALHDLSIDERVEFLAGYGLSPDQMREVAPLMKALNVINYAPHIQQHADANDMAALEQYRLRLGGTLDLYSL